MHVPYDAITGFQRWQYGPCPFKELVATAAPASQPKLAKPPLRDKFISRISTAAAVAAGCLLSVAPSGLQLVAVNCGTAAVIIALICTELS